MLSFVNVLSGILWETKDSPQEAEEIETDECDAHHDCSYNQSDSLQKIVLVKMRVSFKVG